VIDEFAKVSSMPPERLLARAHYRLNQRKHAEIKEVLKLRLIDMGLPDGDG
jgi:hypothetical protein